MRLMIACRAIDNMAGGVERQALALANEMSKRGHDVCLFTLDHDQAKAFYDLRKTVRWYKLGMGDPSQKASWMLRFKRMLCVRQIMREFKPNVCLAFQDGMFIALRGYTLGMGIPVVVAERETPERHKYVKYRTPLKLVLFLFRFAKHITVQCESYVALYPKNLQCKMTVIPNAIQPAIKFAYPKRRLSKTKTILCVGRLTYQKNHQVLFYAFSQIHLKYPEWIIQCIGDGELKAHLIKEAKAFKIHKKVEFIAATKNISDYYANADCLCLQSRWEGFPNVLGEALAHGLPAIGYEKCGGIVDLIQDGYNGFVAPGNDDSATLKNALIRMMTSQKQMEYMSSTAIESVKIYKPNIVYSQWERLFKELIYDKNN